VAVGRKIVYGLEGWKFGRLEELGSGNSWERGKLRNRLGLCSSLGGGLHMLGGPDISN
jgi:hypothetical protein